MVNRYLQEFRANFQSNRGARMYVDVAVEGPPRFPGDPTVTEHPDEPEATEADDMEEPPEPEAEAATPRGQVRPSEHAPVEDEHRGPRRRLDESLGKVSEPMREPSRPASAVSRASRHLYLEVDHTGSEQDAAFMVDQSIGCYDHQL